MSAADDVFAEKMRLVKMGLEPKTVTVPAETYHAAYRFMHQLYQTPGTIEEVVDGNLVPVTRPMFPLPVPEDGYRLWGVTVLKAE